MFRASRSGPEEPLEDIPVVWVLGKLEEELIALRIAVREVRVPAAAAAADIRRYVECLAQLRREELMVGQAHCSALPGERQSRFHIILGLRSK
jgi:hypothetical protein